MLILRAALRLARLEQARGDRDEAARTLRETFQGMTEGRGTPDLREAAEFLAASTSGNG